MMSEELKLCPSCKSDNVIGSVALPGAGAPILMKAEHWIYCRDCGVRGPTKDSRHECEVAWSDMSPAPGKEK